MVYIQLDTLAGLLNTRGSGVCCTSLQIDPMAPLIGVLFGRLCRIRRGNQSHNDIFAIKIIPFRLTIYGYWFMRPSSYLWSLTANFYVTITALFTSCDSVRNATESVYRRPGLADSSQLPVDSWFTAPYIGTGLLYTRGNQYLPLEIGITANVT
ncbi:hypothetical protein DM02DRAFT_204251 [Periconia macrospinosa]|uniref:Uncharacterized protein n=1 Tax=Periconia macrospinosa TaxID=97972 RepID=A0A2V1D7N4_9PLEO|nr:hypothetical protein DM02DRAFT_204251 [Periconia macrospinosa]